MVLGRFACFRRNLQDWLSKILPVNESSAAGAASEPVRMLFVHPESADRAGHSVSTPRTERGILRAQIKLSVVGARRACVPEADQQKNQTRNGSKRKRDLQSGFNYPRKEPSEGEGFFGRNAAVESNGKIQSSFLSSYETCLLYSGESRGTVIAACVSTFTIASGSFFGARPIGAAQSVFFYI